MSLVCEKAVECKNTGCPERTQHEELPWCKCPCTNGGQFPIPGVCNPVDKI